MKAGWDECRLGELCAIRNGKSNTEDAVADGAYAFFDRSKSIKRSSRYLYDCEALIIPGEGTEFLPRHFVGKFDLHQRAYALHGFSGRIDVKYLFHYLVFFKDYFPRVAVGATVKSLRMRHFEQLPVLVPRLEEQRRIVAILDEAFDGIAAAKANAEKNLRNAREVFESSLSTAFAKLERDSPTARAMDLCTRITVGHVGSMAAEYKADGIPFLRSQNIRPFSVSLDNVVYIDKKFHASLGKSRLLPGDLAIVRTGYPGTAAVIPDWLGEANCSDLVIVRCKPGVDPNFLALFFNSSFGKELVAGRLVGAAQKHFNVTAAKEVLVPDLPIVEQQAVVARFDALREATTELETVYHRKLTALESLKASLLHQAFTGNL
ncbi:MAG: restriction endonuclease subunit S [Myxococcota bacterium]